MRRVLFVCEGNIHRSRTAADLYARTPGLKVRSAGLAASARVQICEELIEWADVLIVLEQQFLRLIRRRLPQVVIREAPICLDIADEYQYMQRELIVLLTNKLVPHLGPPVAPAEA